MDHDELQRLYGSDEFYWGTDPNGLAETVLEFAPERKAPAAVDIGSGEGRDAVYLAEQGYGVLAVDPVPNGLRKAERLAEERDVHIQTRTADINDLDFPAMDVVYSCGALQYLRPDNRESQFERFKTATTDGGIHVLFAFVDHPEIPTAPDWGDNEFFYEQGELGSYYDDWDLLAEDEFVFDDESGGEPHQHAAETIVVAKPEA
ncbi:MULTISPECIES: methyltransferase domain-containing protein [unclassified Haladaptatus]|uniref:methyltransferase domain-containing protein n=1 Tax=unclassified Haladaptatus TaxID=2622732 RepID=UPI00209C0FD7|nr:MULTISPECIES: methyltransferase domain-containing protein [unclassified Haladaptatus]MCO8244628.1 methyltransferase domain-containing protein [Haladaptatus sp. AB643]MCO8253750.1 methyltransferase domain-containing protein [Haladaptatus sp. AB618]